MKPGRSPDFAPSEHLPAHFRSLGIGFRSFPPLELGFGRGNDQYRLFSYPAPAPEHTMGLFCEWHTEDFFDVDTGPHLAIGMRGPTVEAPHRGRGLAIGTLANSTSDPGNPDVEIPLFAGCPDAPGGPSFFIEDFSRNDGIAPIRAWQLSLGRELPLLRGNGTYRIDIHVTAHDVWAGVWKIDEKRKFLGSRRRRYLPLGEIRCSAEGPAFSGDGRSPCPEHESDRGRGNAFIGTGFANPETRSWVDHIHIAHW